MLLRTGGADGETDWHYVLQPLLSGASAQAHAAWIFRMTIDRSTSDVTGAADQLIQAMTPELLGSNDTVRAAAALAIGHCSDHALAEFIHNYRSVPRQRAIDPDAELAKALIHRDEMAEPPFAWLEASLNGGGADLKEHLLTAVAMTYGQRKGEGGREIFEHAIRASYSSDLDELTRGRLRAIILNEAHAWSYIDDSFLDVAAALEKTGVLTEGGEQALTHSELQSALQSLRAKFPWLGKGLHKLDEHVETLEITDGFNGSLPLGGDTWAQGGDWWRIVLQEPLTLTLSGNDGGLDWVVMDLERRTEVARAFDSADKGEGQLHLYVPTGTYAMSLRRAPSPGKNPPTVSISAHRGSVPLGVHSEDAPMPVVGSAAYLLSGGETGGEGWLRLSLDAGAVLSVRTRPDGDPSLDTYVSVFDTATGLELDYDDDGGEGAYSALVYRTEEPRDVKVRISLFGPTPLAPGDSFMIDVGVTSDHAAALAAAERESAPELASGSSYVSLETDPAWLAFTVTEPGVHRVEITGAALLGIVDEAEMGVPRFEVAGLPPDAAAVFFADGAGRVFFRLSGYVEATIELDRIDDPAALPGGPGGMDPDRVAVIPVPQDGLHLSLNVARGDTARLSLIGTSPPRIDVTRGGAPVTEVGRREVPDGVRLEWPIDAEGDYSVAVAPPGAGERAFLVTGLAMTGGEYDGLRIGDRVVLGRHEAIDGSTNWSDSMDQYVGCLARITELHGMDTSGSYIVGVDLRYADGEQNWVWRTRNMVAVDEQDAQPPHCQAYAALR